MGSRYLITGVQIGILMTLRVEEKRQQLLQKIQDDQHIGNSDRPISEDCKKAEGLFM